MKIRKAVIPAAGYGTRFLPITKSIPKEMLPIIDKPAIQYIVEEAVASGIDEILIITNSQKQAIENHFDRNWELEYFLYRKGNTKDLNDVIAISNIANIHTTRQKEQKGLGHAILQAKTFVGNEPFAILLGDDMVRNDEYPCVKQLVDLYSGSSIVGVQSVPDSELGKYGIVKPNGNLVNNCVEITDMVEKPKNNAPSNYAVLGRYILTPKIFELLETQEPGANGEIQLTDSIKRLMEYEKVYAYNFIGKRYDIGTKKGYIEAIMDYAKLRNYLT